MHAVPKNLHKKPDVAVRRVTYEVAELIQALHDERVVNALEMALRDQQIRLRFRKLRMRMTVMEACETLAEAFFLSPERVKSIVYRQPEKERRWESADTMNAGSHEPERHRRLRSKRG